MNEYIDNSTYAKLNRFTWRFKVAMRIILTMTGGWFRGLSGTLGIIRDIESGLKLISVKSDVTFVFKNKDNNRYTAYSGKKRSER